MSAAYSGKTVRTEDEIGPNGDKHAMTIDNTYREVHLGSWARACAICREAKRQASKE